VERQITTKLDDSCDKSATEIFQEYEKLGWVAEGGDNCGVDGVTKEIKEGNKVLFDDDADTTDVLKGPQEYELVYTITDENGLFRHHTAVVKLEDDSPPTAMDGCPSDIFIEIEAHEKHCSAEWQLPYLTEDNCLGTEPAPATPVEAQGIGRSHPTKNETWRFTVVPVGVTPMAYTLADGSGNKYHEECRFTIECKQKANPVKLTCPADIVERTLDAASFAVVSWDTPVAKQGDKVLDASHITYKHSVGPGMPFPYGETTVTVVVKGEVTGTRTHEEEQGDECTFNIKVNDPERPYVDGRHFRCDGDAGELAEPYGVCKGPEVLATLHGGYEDTGGYDVTGVSLRERGCCKDEKGTAHTCTPTAAGSTVSYCLPTLTPVPAVPVPVTKHDFLPASVHCDGKKCGDSCFVGDMGGQCNAKLECSFDYQNLGCVIEGKVEKLDIPTPQKAEKPTPA